jgi:hypothetical protein
MTRQKKRDKEVEKIYHLSRLNGEDEKKDNYVLVEDGRDADGRVENSHSIQKNNIITFICGC